MTRQLYSGPISGRFVYRWLRSRPRLCSDVYLTIRWWCVGDDMPDPVRAALMAFDLPCKTLDDRVPGRWEVRTKSWYGREDAIRAWIGWRSGEYRHGWTKGRGDRVRGLMYARLLANLLRTAHEHGVAMIVEETVMNSYEQVPS